MNSLARIAATTAVAVALGVSAASATEITFYYPIAVGGPITKIFDGYAEAFHKAHPDITVKPVYTGSYQDSIVKAMTAAKAGNAPDVAILLSTDMFTLIDNDLIEPIDAVATSDSDKVWIKSFYPAFMENSQADGHTWGIPFQRSTIVQYWNKDAFKAAGLDPEKAPKTWDEMVSFGKKLTKKDASGRVTQWGVEIPSSGFPYWLFQALAIENGVNLMNQAGTEVYYDKPEVIAAVQYWVDLVNKYKVHPPGIVEWGTTPKDFFERKVAMIWTTTGNLTNVKNNAKFDFGVAMLPANKQRGSPTGGGNFYLFKKSTPQQREAAFKFIKWATSPERAAQWGIDTGYVAVRKDAWDTSVMKQYVAGFPAAAVARDQLPYAKAELSTHDNQRVTKALNDGLQAALTGTKKPDQAMKDAQREADRILKAYK